MAAWDISVNKDTYCISYILIYYIAKVDNYTIYSELWQHFAMNPRSRKRYATREINRFSKWILIYC